MGNGTPPLCDVLPFETNNDYLRNKARVIVFVAEGEMLF